MTYSMTISCDQCGKRIISGGGYRDAAHLGRRFSDGSEIPRCPNCSKLTYGPLTEKMVADALRVSDEPFRDGGEYSGMARFVLRLLRDEQLFVYPPTLNGGITAEDWRDALLEIARL